MLSRLSGPRRMVSPSISPTLIFPPGKSVSTLNGEGSGADTAGRGSRRARAAARAINRVRFIEGESVAEHFRAVWRRTEKRKSDCSNFPPPADSPESPFQRGTSSLAYEPSPRDRRRKIGG